MIACTRGLLSRPCLSTRPGSNKRTINPLALRHAAGGGEAAVAAPQQTNNESTAEPPRGHLAPYPASHVPLLTPRNMLLLNGRLAMGGMAMGVAGELLHHTPLATQILAGAPALLTAAGVLALASAMPLLLGEEEGDEVFGPFTPTAEIINGEAALFGLVTMLAVEAALGAPLL